MFIENHRGPKKKHNGKTLVEIKVEAQKVQADIDDSKARTTTSSFEATLKYKTAEKDREFKREAALLKYHTDVAKSKEQSRSKARERAFGKRSNF